MMSLQKLKTIFQGLAKKMLKGCGSSSGSVEKGEEISLKKKVLGLIPCPGKL
jgi:hypothetical protein